MAWILDDRRKCPSCGHDKSIFIIAMRDGAYSLSCGWCCFLSDAVPAKEAFFTTWLPASLKKVSVVKLNAIPHYFKGEKFYCDPIEVWDTNGPVSIIRKGVMP